MNTPPIRWTDQRIEHFLGHLLRYGVILAATVVFLGGIAYLREWGAAEPKQKVFRGEPEDLRHPHSIIEGALAFESRALIQFGLLLLIATPVARVVFSAIGFFLQGDRLYVVVTLFVFVVLIYSLAGPHP
jgi:uncharacterized membrane protein